MENSTEAQDYESDFVPTERTDGNNNQPIGSTYGQGGASMEINRLQSASVQERLEASSLRPDQKAGVLRKLSEVGSDTGVAEMRYRQILNTFDDLRPDDRAEAAFLKSEMFRMMNNEY